MPVKWRCSGSSNTAISVSQDEFGLCDITWIYTIKEGIYCTSWMVVDFNDNTVDNPPPPYCTIRSVCSSWFPAAVGSSLLSKQPEMDLRLQKVWRSINPVGGPEGEGTGEISHLPPQVWLSWFILCLSSWAYVLMRPALLFSLVNETLVREALVTEESCEADVR